MGRVINNIPNNIKKFDEKTINEVRKLIIDTAVRIEIQAQRNAPRDTEGDLFIVINKKISNNGLRAEVGVMGENDLAAYFEFGTGLSAREILAGYPEWVKKIAIEFFVTGRGTLKGKPYFYPAVFKFTEDFKTRLRKLINN